MGALVVGLTGGIGSGKSTVARLFELGGAGVIDTDAIAHELTQPAGAAMPAIIQAFGEEFLEDTGALNRTRMRELVFTDGEAKRRLEAILHPRIRMRAITDLTNRREPYVIMVVPLLLETGAYSALISRVLVVDCPEDLQIARAGARSGLTPDRVRQIMAAQIDRDQRLARADDVIDNSGAVAALDHQVAALDAKYRQLSQYTDSRA